MAAVEKAKQKKAKREKKNIFKKLWRNAAECDYVNAHRTFSVSPQFPIEKSVDKWR